MVRQQNATPTRKVTAVAAVNALALIVAYLLRNYAEVEIGADMQAAIATVLTGLVGYYTPPGSGDGITQDPPVA